MCVGVGSQVVEIANYFKLPDLGFLAVLLWFCVLAYVVCSSS